MGQNSSSDFVFKRGTSQDINLTAKQSRHLCPLNSLHAFIARKFSSYVYVMDTNSSVALSEAKAALDMPLARRDTSCPGSGNQTRAWN